ncbi:MAG TPA: M48 family metalloprotease [Gemmatimonadaceae bacterium]|nr:M48 family metalloprotease [Gemmatimonadaceae bacterium]
MPIVSALAIALAVTPGVIAWWTGRAVLTRVEDPMLPELLLERRRRLTGFTLGGAVVIALLFASDALWAIPLLWIGLLVSSYPLRRALFGERWSALAFLRYAISSAIGHFGVWMLIGFAPAIVTSLALGLEPFDNHAAIRIALWTGAAFAVVIVVWQHNYARVFLALHRAAPLRATARPELMARLDAIVERAGSGLRRRPEIYRYGAPGGYVMNALAVPSLSYPAVALGDTLLATFDDNEIAGVFAHEVAHHEQFTRGRLWRAWIAGLVLAALTVVLPALLISSAASVALLTSWCVPLFVIVTLGRRASKRRDDETASDLRATVLTGDPAALARALTKLHVYSRVPRRWPHAIERAATHPSLARRIQALRERGGTLEPHVPEVNAVVRSTSGAVVALDNERAYWFEGVPAEATLALDGLRAAASSYRATAYRDLAELRVATQGTGRAIVATDLAGRSWSAPIEPNDVPVVQAALDTVDVKLGQRRATAPPASAPAVRWLALALLVTLAMGGELGFAFLPLLVMLIRPTLTAAVAATATIALARILVAARVIAWADPIRQLAALGAVSVSIVLVILAARRARLDASRGAPRRIAREAWLVIGLLAATVLLMGLAVAPVAIGRPASLIGNPVAISAATILLGLGAALLTLPQKWWRASGAFVSLCALAGGSTLARGSWSLGGDRSLKWSNGSLRGAGSVAIAGGGLTLTASPNGEAFAVTQYHQQRSRPTTETRYVIGRFGDPRYALRTSEAIKIAFADSQTVLALVARGSDSLELRAERVPGDSSGRAAVLWREALPMLENPQLLVDRGRRSWLVVGRGDGDGSTSFIVVADSFAGDRPRTSKFGEHPAESETGEMMAQPLAAFPDGSAIWVTLARLQTHPTALSTIMMALTGTIRWELYASAAGRERFLADVDGFPLCAAEIDRDRALCIDRSPNATRVWSAGSASAVERIADLPPSLDVVHVESADYVAAAERFGSRLVLADPARREAKRLTIPGVGSRADGRWTADVVARGRYVLMLSAGRDGATVSRFEVR